MEMLSKAIEVSWQTYRSDGGRGIPLLFWGSPGIGKSAIISSLAKQMGVHCETVVLSVRDPSDVCGLPVKTENGVRLVEPVWARNLIKNNGGILFFDELNCAPPAVQAAALRIVCERVVGEVELPANTLIVAACNPPEEGANTGDLEPPLSNRFCHFDLTPDVDMFCDFLTLGKQRKIDINPIDREVWEEEYSHITALISKYLSTDRTKVQGSVSDRSFASPRTWEMTARLWTTCRCKKASPLSYISGCIGEGFAQEVYKFIAESSLPSPRDILYNNQMPQKIDEIYVATKSTLSFVLKYNEHAPKFCEVLNSLGVEDVKVQMIKYLLDADLGNSQEFVNLVEGVM